MNLAFKSFAAPLFYFPRMGEGSPYDRYEDIWCGYVAQRIGRELGYAFTVGQPWVDHNRASDPFKNTIKEASGLEPNEVFWQILDGIDISEALEADGAEQRLDRAVALLAEALAHGKWVDTYDYFTSSIPAGFIEYLAEYGACLDKWRKLLWSTIK
jgi:hypothetical protein